jgi:hypothetical protein
MRVVKLGLISFFILFGVITLISSLLPSRIRISRAIDIAENRAALARTLQNMASWKEWNVFAQSFQDPLVLADTLRGGKYAVFLTGKSDSLVTAWWKQPGGRDFSSGFNLVAQDSNHTTLQWYFDFRLRWYPWEKFQGIIYDQQLGPDMEKSLQNLKTRAEQFP